MGKKRVSFIDSSEIDDSKLSALERRRKRKQERAKNDNYIRASYDMLPAIKNALKRRANIIGLSQSQLAMFLLSDALRRLDNGEIDPLPYLIDSSSPAYRHNLDQSAEWVFNDDSKQ